MSEAERRDGSLRVIFAVEDEAERAAFSAAMAAASPDCELFFPSTIANVEAIYLNDLADAIVTDFRFHSGALADWLTFWPLPAVLLVDPEEDMGRVERTVHDEAALFVQRMPGNAHIRFLPLLIRKALNIRESGARQNAHLQMSEHQYLNLLQAVPDIVYMLDAMGRFVYLNDAVRQLGYEPSALIGKHFSEIVHPDDLARVSRLEALRDLGGVCTGDDGAPKLFDERRSGKRMTRNLEIRLRPGSLLGDYQFGSVNAYGEVNCSGFTLPEFEGRDQGTVGLIRDVSVRKERQQALEAALNARDILLKEIHHRVKNNLQVISSLLNIQESAIADPEARKVFTECQTQVQTMSLVHEALYRSSSRDGVEMQAYFEQLVDYLASVYEGSSRGIALAVEAPGVLIELDEAIPVALAVNELVSNSMKHAFPDGRQGRIGVGMRAVEGDWVLEVSDDGVGFDGMAGRGAGSKAAGIGTELVEALATQLRGAVSRGPGPGDLGSVVRIVFPRAAGLE